MNGFIRFACVTVLTSVATTNSVAIAETETGVFDFEINAIADGVHLLSRPGALRQPVEGNVTVIQQSSGVVLIDAGGTTASGQNIVARVRQITDLPIRYIAITHWHGDHHLGAAAIKEAYPDVQIVSHTNTGQHMSGDAMDYLQDMPGNLKATQTGLEQLFSPDNADAQKLAPEIMEWYAQMHRDLDDTIAAVQEFRISSADLTFSERLVLDDPVRPVELLHLGRGNTDGDIVAWLPQQQLVVTGDLVVHPSPFGFGSFASDWIDTLEAIQALNYQTLIPGHGAIQKDQRYLDLLKKAMTTVQIAVAPYKDSQLTSEEVYQKLDLSSLRQEFSNNDPVIDLAFRRWFETPFVKHALQQARGEPIIQGE